MKSILYGLGILVVVALVAVFGFGINMCSKATDTAGEMADKTVFNADKHVYSYENFREILSSYEQYMTQWKGAAKLVDRYEENGQMDTQAYNNAVMQRDGSWQMMGKISAEYNAMSRIAYQKVWKGDLPARLDMPDIDEILNKG